MNYLITGATGFIGRQLVQRLLSEGHTVNYLARARGRDMDDRAAFFSWHSNALPPLDCMGRLDAIIHLAGEPVAQRWTAAAKKRIWDSRVDLTRRLVDAIGTLRHKPSVLVSASAIGYYGNGGESILTESSPAGTGFLADLCVQWEQQAIRARDFGLRTVPIRIALVLGPGGGMMKQLLPLFRTGLGGKLASGKQWMSWIHTEDLLRLLIFAAEHTGTTATVNASSPHPARNQDFTRELAKSVRRPALFRVPRFALRLALGPVADHVLDSSRVLPEAALAQGFEFHYPQLASCLSAIANQYSEP